MASICWLPNSNHSIRPTSSLVLSQRHTTAATQYDTLLPDFTKGVLNPIKTSQMRKNNIRKTKTDKVDSYVIAKTLMMQYTLRFISFYYLNLMELKALGRFRQKAIKQRTRLKIQLKTYVNHVFSELQYFFKSGLHQMAVYAVLKEVPSPNRIASMNMSHLATLLKTTSHVHFTKEHANKLRVFTQESAGTNNITLYIQITQSIEQIELLDSQLKKIEDKICIGQSSLKYYQEQLYLQGLL